MSRARRRLAGAAVVVAAVAGCTGGAADPMAGVARPSTPAPALAACAPAGSAAADTVAPRLPDLTLPCLGPGDPVPLRALTGTPTVVNLWASWCRPCLEELPAFVRLQRAAGDRLRVLGVASQDRREAAASYAAENVPFASLVDADGELARGLGRRGLPITLFVQANGAVVEVYQGTPLTDATLRRLVRGELGVDV